MNIELLQDMINFLSYEISSHSATIEELIEKLKSEFANDTYYPTGSDPIAEYPDEVKSAFGSANDGELYDEYLQYSNNSTRITESKLRSMLRKVILEYGESDADVIKQSQNRERMIGRGMDMGTMPFNPSWDYDTKPASSRKKGVMGDVIRQVSDRLEQHQIGDYMEVEATSNTNVIKIKSGDMVVVVTNNRGEFKFEMKAPRKWRDKWQETCYSVDSEIDEVLNSLDDWIMEVEMMEMGEG